MEAIIERLEILMKEQIAKSEALSKKVTEMQNAAKLLVDTWTPEQTNAFLSELLAATLESQQADKDLVRMDKALDELYSINL